MLDGRKGRNWDPNARPDLGIQFPELPEDRNCFLCLACLVPAQGTFQQVLSKCLWIQELAIGIQGGIRSSLGISKLAGTSLGLGSGLPLSPPHSLE